MDVDLRRQAVPPDDPGVRVPRVRAGGLGAGERPPDPDRSRRSCRAAHELTARELALTTLTFTHDGLPSPLGGAATVPPAAGSARSGRRSRSR